jgi:hypothetical protein
LKISLLALLISLSTTLAFGQWDLLATQATSPDAVAIDNCGNAFARVANRVYRSADLGQTWESVLDVTGLSDASYRFTTTNGNVNFTSYSTQSGALNDYRFACDGTVDTSTFQSASICATLPFEIISRNDERIFTFKVFAALGIVTTHGIAVDEGLGNRLEVSPVTIPEPYFYELEQDRNSGDLEFNAQPEIPASSVATPPSIQPLGLLDQGYSIVTSEQAQDFSFSDYSIVVAQRDSNGTTTAVAVATYSVANAQWSTTSIDPVGFETATTINNNQFLFQYANSLELREATTSASLLVSTMLPLDFQLGNFTEDLSYVIGTSNGRVVTLHDDNVSVASSLAKGFSNWSPTLSGSILAPSGAGFEEYTDNSSTPALIDLDVEERFLLSETFGGFTYSIRQLNDRKQFLATSPSGTTEVLIDELDQSLMISDGGDDARVVREGSKNFRLELGSLTPMSGQFSDLEILVRGIDTLYSENRTAFIKRGNQVVTLSDESNSTPLLLEDVYVVQKIQTEFGPMRTVYQAFVYDIQTLDFLGNFALSGPIQRRDAALFTSIANRNLSGGPFTSLFKIQWDGQSLIEDPVNIPSFIARNSGEKCLDEFWQNFTQTVSGYDNLQHLNGNTFISGIHGVFKTDDCITPIVQREDVCLEPGVTFMWNGQAIDTPGFYEAISTSPSACDQIEYLQAGQSATIRATECFLEGASIPFQDTSFSLPGTYVFNSVDAAGCAQLEELTITPPDTFRLDTMVLLGEILFGEEVVSNGQQITTSRDVADCTEIFVYTISLVSSTSQVTGADRPKVYPTLLGADRTFQLETAGQEVQKVEVFTLSGKQVDVRPSNSQWQISAVQAGWYIVRIQTTKGSSSARVLVK